MNNSDRPQSPAVVQRLAELRELQRILVELEEGKKTDDQFLEKLLKPKLRSLKLTNEDWMLILRDVNFRRRSRASTNRERIGEEALAAASTRVEGLDALSLLSMNDDTPLSNERNKTLASEAHALALSQQAQRELFEDLRRNKKVLESHSTSELYASLGQASVFVRHRNHRRRKAPTKLVPLEEAPKTVLSLPVTELDQEMATSVHSNSDNKSVAKKKVAKGAARRALFAAPARREEKSEKEIDSLSTSTGADSPSRISTSRNVPVPPSSRALIGTRHSMSSKHSAVSREKNQSKPSPPTRQAGPRSRVGSMDNSSLNISPQN
eukprot:g5654.t1